MKIWKKGDEAKLAWSIFGSEGPSLHFPCESSDLYEEYKQRRYDLDMEFYGKLRERHGVWASNQSKFVTEPEELHGWDNKSDDLAYLVWLTRAKQG